MLYKQISPSLLCFYSSFEEQLSHDYPLYKFAHKANWQTSNEAISMHYSALVVQNMAANHLKQPLNSMED